MNKIQKDQKQPPLLRCLEQKQGAEHDRYTQTTPLWPESWTCPPSLTLFKGPASPSSENEQENLLPIFTPSC